MKCGSPIRRRKSFAHYQLNSSFELAQQLMVCVRIHVHQALANWSDTNACIGYELVGIASYMNLTTRSSRFESRELGTGEKCTDEKQRDAKRRLQSPSPTSPASPPKANHRPAMQEEIGALYPEAESQVVENG